MDTKKDLILALLKEEKRSLFLPEPFAAFVGIITLLEIRIIPRYARTTHRQLPEKSLGQLSSL